jgi:hypothetical protein
MARNNLRHAELECYKDPFCFDDQTSSDSYTSYFGKNQDQMCLDIFENGSSSDFQRSIGRHIPVHSDDNEKCPISNFSYNNDFSIRDACYELDPIRRSRGAYDNALEHEPCSRLIRCDLTDPVSRTTGQPSWDSIRISLRDYVEPRKVGQWAVQPSEACNG